MSRRRIIPLLGLVLTVALVVGLLPGFAAGQPHRTGAHDRSHRRSHHRAHRRSHATADAPSGVPMPTGNIRGWRQVLADDFTGSTLDPLRWRAYLGQPARDPGGWFDPSHVTVSHGEMMIGAYRDPAYGDRWVTGGVSSSPGLAQTYGKYLVRVRVQAGQGIAQTIQLWPANGGWPPEVDFSEDNGANRRTDYGFVHYGATNQALRRAQVAVNLTHWHTLGVTWTPGRLVYTLDGRVWARVASREVPSIPMVLDIQTESWACGTSTWEHCPNATTPSHVNMYVDWAVAYARSATKTSG